MTRSILSLAVAASLLLLAPAGRAGPKDQDMEEAKRRFDKAETAYKLGNYKSAIEEYEAAYKALPDPAFLFNIAQAHRQQYSMDKEASHLHRALSLYKTYLRDSPRPHNRETVENLIEELKQIISAVESSSREQAKKKGRIVLRGHEAEGAAILLDQEAWGTVPKRGEVEPGSHLIEVVKPGFLRWTTTLKVSPGSETDIPVMLQPGSKGDGGEGPPVYKRWWFWTILAVAAAGAGTGIGLGVYYGTSNGDNVPAMPEIDLR